MTEMSVLLCAPQNVAQKICPVMEEEIIMVVCSLSFATQAKVVQLEVMDMNVLFSVLPNVMLIICNVLKE